MGYFLLDTTTIPPQTITDITSITSAETFGEPICTLLNYLTINTESITSLETFGIPQLNQNILPESIISAEVFGDLVIGNGDRTIYPVRIASGELFGVPKLTMYILPTSITTAQAFDNPTIGFYIDEPFEKSKQRTSNWKAIKQEIGNRSMIDETIWDYALTIWDNGSTHWDAITDSVDIMKKINPSTTFVTQSKQGSTTFNKNSQRSTSFTKIKER